MMLLDTLYTMQDLEALVKKLNTLIIPGSIVTFVGSLGAGKTTLIRALLRARGVVDPVTSPTFSYVNYYHAPNKERFFHFDLYRLDSVQQFVSAGFDEYFEDAGATILVEWPEIIMPLLCTKGYIAITLDYVDDEHRRIVVRQEGIKND